MNTLRKSPGNVKKDIKIVKGKLLMDKVKIDNNTFFIRCRLYTKINKYFDMEH